MNKANKYFRSYEYFLLAHVNFKDDTETFEVSEVYNLYTVNI